MFTKYIVITSMNQKAKEELISPKKKVKTEEPQ